MFRTGFASALIAVLVAAATVACVVTWRGGGRGPRTASTIGHRTPGLVTEKATFGGGCFWGVESAFREVEGVVATAVGYMGGDLPQPTYADVCTHETGHAEVVEVEFDPAKVSYGQLLEVFWANHDPTTLNRQGPDIGPQYRSVIFFHSPSQQAAAEESKARRHEFVRRHIVTEIVPAAEFWKAEEYHQQYLEKRGLGSCRW